MIISISFLAPDYVLSKFYPKFNEQKLIAENIQELSFDPVKEVHIKVTRVTEYGERYKLFVIDREKFKNKYNLEEYGVTLSEQNDQLIVDKLNWKGEAKKSGMQIGDIISNFKIENLERPNKAIVYPFSFLLLLIFGYNNYRRKQEWVIMLKQIYRWFCYIGIHRYDIIDTKYGFGAAGSTETVKCKDCAITKIRPKR